MDDDTRISKLIIKQPYMGILDSKSSSSSSSSRPSSNWLQPYYQNMCINSCWELYGATDRNHLPSSGSRYQLIITQPDNNNNNNNDNDNIAFVEEVEEKDGEVKSELSSSLLPSAAADVSRKAIEITRTAATMIKVSNDSDEKHVGVDDRSVSVGGNNELEYCYYNFTTWEQDEGNGICPSCTIHERHDEIQQEVIINISV